MTESNAMTERESLVYKAKLCEQAERYDEMADVMKIIAHMGEDLTVEERNLLSVAYKNAVGSRRASWRIISSIEQKEQSRSTPHREALAKDYKAKIEEELQTICNDILGLLGDHLIPKTDNPESKVFFFKMKGDYFRYISEFLSTHRPESAENAHAAYSKASEIAGGELPPTHPIRLGLALNYSVFHYEIKNDPDSAIERAQKAFDDAISELDNVSDDSYKDSTLIMQLLRDNLTLWTSDTTNEETKA